MTKLDFAFVLIFNTKFENNSFSALISSVKRLKINTNFRGQLWKRKGLIQ